MLFPDFTELMNLRRVVNCLSVAIDKTTNNTHGDYASLFHGLGVEFETVRPYVVGDDVRYIDWRVTARIGKPHIKTFRAESDRNVMIVVDSNAYMRFGTRSTFKSVQAAKIAGLLCWKSLQQQDRVGGLIFGDVKRGIKYFKPSKSDISAIGFLKTLSDTAIGVHDAVLTSTAIKYLSKMLAPQSLVFLIGDFSAQSQAALETSLISLGKKCKLILLPIYDQADIEIPDVGQIEFVNGQQRGQINTNNLHGQQRYHDMWKSYHTALQQMSKKLKINLLWISTAMDPIKSLFANTGSILKWKS